MEDPGATPVDYQVEWPGRAHLQQFSISFNPEKIVHFLTCMSGLRVSVVQWRPSVVTEFGEPRSKQPLDQPAAILTNILDIEQHFFTRGLTYW